MQSKDQANGRPGDIQYLLDAASQCMVYLWYMHDFPTLVVNVSNLPLVEVVVSATPISNSTVAEVRTKWL